MLGVGAVVLPVVTVVGALLWLGLVPSRVDGIDFDRVFVACVPVAASGILGLLLAIAAAIVARRRREERVLPLVGGLVSGAAALLTVLQSILVLAAFTS